MRPPWILAQLRAERGRIGRAIAAIEGLSSTGRRIVACAPTATADRNRRGRMSAAGRRKLSRLMKQRWAQGKMKPRAKVEQVRASKPVRKMSQAARRKIAAAQRATNVSQGFRKAHHRRDHEKAGSGVPKRCGTGGTPGHVVNVWLTVHSSLPVSQSRSFNPGRTSGAAGIQ
jgi:hypothetical protein